MTTTSQPVLAIPAIRSEVRGHVIAHGLGVSRYDGGNLFRLNPNILPGSER